MKLKSIFARKSAVLAFALGASCAAPFATAQSLDTHSIWDGTTSLWAWGLPADATSTYGQLITATSSLSHINSFTFWLEGSTQPKFQAYIYEWDPVANHATGSALYTSPITTAPNSPAAYQAVTFTTGGVTLQAGKQYVILFTTAGIAGNSDANPAGSSYRWAANMPSPSYAGGHFTWFNTSNITDLNGVSWDGPWLTGEFAFLFLTGPSAADTLASMQGNASALRKIFSLQASYVNPGLSYDCSLFDAKGVCVAFSGRATSTNGSGPEATSGVLTAAYKVNPNVRVGAFIEQNASSYTDNGVHVSNNNPDFGLFAVWSQTEAGEGVKVRGAVRYGSKAVSITRDLIGSSEAGLGNSKLSTQGAQLTVSNGFRLKSNLLVSPYAGLRYIRIQRNGYAEFATDAVTTPLTYAALRQEATSALAGVNLAAEVSPALTLLASVGAETDLSHSISDYTATGLSDLGLIKFSDNTRKTRAVGSAGAAYKISKTQQLSAQVFYRDEAFDSTSTRTGMITYTAGF